MDTLRYTKMIEETGLTRKQAEIQVQVLAEVIGESLVTKQDLMNFDTKLQSNLDKKFNAIDKRFTAVDRKFDAVFAAIKESENKVILKLGALMVVLFTIMSGLIVGFFALFKYLN